MGRKGRPPPPNINVSEASRIQISKRLEDFRASQDEVLTFEPTLTNPERAAVHMLCRKMGMLSKSSGRGNQRCVSVYKNKTKRDPASKGKEDSTFLLLSDFSQEILSNLFTQYPPDESELGEEANTDLSRKLSKIHGMRDSLFRKPLMSKDEITDKMEVFSGRVENEASLKQIVEERSKLPIASYRDTITSTIDSHQVVLISGETGCGKTTQVPQFLLDHVWGKGEVCKVVCTQPRRISAISVAERISFERGENVGDTIGYKIRMESKGGRHSSVIFCTTGILLRMMISMGAQAAKTAEKGTPKTNILEISHIIVDEIHERDRYSDFMLAILRDFLPLCPNLRMILMSATIDAERFSQYFGGCPIIRIPGFTYPVKTFYLEDVLAILEVGMENHLSSHSSTSQADDDVHENLKAGLDEAIDLALSTDECDPLLEILSTEADLRINNYQHSVNGVSPLMVFAGKGRLGDVCMLLSCSVDCHLRDKDGLTALRWAEKEDQEEVVDIIKRYMDESASNSKEKNQLLEKYLATMNPEHIDFVLVERLLRRICIDSSEGAILVFLPGWDDINQTKEKLLSSAFFKDSSKFDIISLHSMIPSMEQKKVFKRPRTGVRKIILSTNIAETAITIDDVVFVVDSGRMKEKSYDPYNNVSTLHSAWISKASAKQREGRAGRCQPGICYHLYSKIRSAALPDFQVPEIKRIPIEELCLQVKLLDPDCKISDFIQKTLDPPVFETIRNAIIVLQDIGALTLEEELTNLGEKLGALPVHPSISKMLFFAILMKCLDPALTLACASDYRDPFILPMAPDEKKKAAAAKVELASLYGGHSDQLTVIAAFECWKRAKEKGKEAQFCSRYFISSSTMRMLSNMRKQLQTELLQSGFILENPSCCNVNSQNPGILHAVLVSGLYPMVGKLLPPMKGNHRRAVVETTSGAKVRLHPHSANFKLAMNKSSIQPLIVYDEITRGDGGMYIKNCTVIGPYPLLLLSTEMAVAPPTDDGCESDDDDAEFGSEDEDADLRVSTSDQQEQIMSSPDKLVSVVLDRWLKYECTALHVAQLYCLRKRLSAAALLMVKHPRRDLPPVLDASIYAISSILSYDGLFGIPPEVYSLDMQTAASSLAKSDKWSRRQSRHQNTTDGFLSSLMREDKAGKSPGIHNSIAPNAQASQLSKLAGHMNPVDKGAHQDRAGKSPGMRNSMAPNAQARQSSKLARHMNSVDKGAHQGMPSKGHEPGGPSLKKESLKRRRGSGPRG